MRKTPIVPGEYYHIFNRGNNKQATFLDERDRARFLFLIIYLQSPTNFQNLSRQVNHFVKNRVFNIKESDVQKVVKERYLELVNFALMPNHFHLIIFESKEGGTARYMQRVLCAHTKYFNTKYAKSGHLFQGPYKAVRVKTNEQLLYLSTYIHRNPREIAEWRGKEHNYPWSSYQDHIKENRWGKLLKPDIVIEQFNDKSEYENFVKSSSAKNLEVNLGGNLLIDS